MLTSGINTLDLAVRAVAVYGTLLLLMRTTGKRTVGQFTPFDLLVVMLISEAAGPTIMGEDPPFLGGILVCVVLISLNALIGIITVKNRGAEKFFEGEAVLLGRDGRVFEAICQKHRVSSQDLKRALREADCELEDLRYAFLEVDGCITIQKEKVSS